jgi:hypothetical protein
MKVDPYKSKQVYERWKEQGANIPDISKKSRDIIINFIFDMEKGLNVNSSNKKGARSYLRLNAYKHKLKLISFLIEKHFKKSIIEVNREQIHTIFNDMRNGKIKRADGKIYLQTSDYAKSFKAFWHWHQKTSKKKIDDLTNDLDVSKDKPKWVYLNEQQFKKLIDNAKPYYKRVAITLLDTGLRGTEFVNIRNSWITNDSKGNMLLDVPDDVSKTVGRKIKLMLSKEVLQEHIQENNFKGDDLLFQVPLSKMNEYFKRLSKRLFGEGKSQGGEKYSMLTIGDFRHISACYWLPRYPTQQGMMYRFGWKKADKVFYYSEFMGMVDNIQQENLLIDITKTELQQQNEKLKKDFELMRDDSKNQSFKFKEMLDLLMQESADFKEKFENKLTHLEKSIKSKK